VKYTLSKRAKELLLLIDKRTDRDWDTGVVRRYFVPLCRDNVSGSGDARCLRSLETKGLIEPMKLLAYSYAITEEGRLWVLYAPLTGRDDGRRV